jgi:hypothetical protein
MMSLMQMELGIVVLELGESVSQTAHEIPLPTGNSLIRVQGSRIPSRIHWGYNNWVVQIGK